MQAFLHDKRRFFGDGKTDDSKEREREWQRYMAPLRDLAHAAPCATGACCAARRDWYAVCQTQGLDGGILELDEESAARQAVVATETSELCSSGCWMDSKTWSVSSVLGDNEAALVAGLWYPDASSPPLPVWYHQDKGVRLRAPEEVREYAKRHAELSARLAHLLRITGARLCLLIVNTEWSFVSIPVLCVCS